MEPAAVPSKPEISQNIVKAASFMIAAAFCFALMNALVREASASMHPLQIAFFRNLFALVLILPLFMSGGLKQMRTKVFGLHVSRALVGIIAMSIWFTAVTLVPLADAVALNFTLPLFATAGAALVLRERVGVRRWGATLVGFLGMVIILRPGFAEVTWITMLPIISAVFMASSVLILKKLSATESPQATVFYMNLIMTPLSLIPALFVWNWPDWYTLGLVSLLGLLAMLAHLALARSYVNADASLVMPFDYARLPFVVMLAYPLYGELPDGWTWLGAAVIATAALYIARRESQLERWREIEPTAAISVAARS